MNTKKLFNDYFLDFLDGFYTEMSEAERLDNIERIVYSAPNANKLREKTIQKLLKMELD